MRPGWETDFVVNGSKTVRLTLFWGKKSYFGRTYVDVIEKARSMLKEHGIGLDLMPRDGNQTDQFTIDEPTAPDELLLPAQYGELRARCAAAFDDQASPSGKLRLPVIFCNFKSPAAGLTIDTLDWLPFCIVGPTPATDRVTLLHEAGHAAGLPHLSTTVTPGGAQNFMFDGAGDRTLMHKTQVQTVANSYYVR